MLLISNKLILHPSVATLIISIQNWCSWRNRSKPIVSTPNTQIDAVQINALEYDLDINGQIDIQPQVPSHAEITPEHSAPVTSNSEEDFMLPQDSNRTEPQSQPDQTPTQYPLHQNTETVSEQQDESRRPQLEDTPELEEEDWEDRQLLMQT